MLRSDGLRNVPTAALGRGVAGEASPGRRDMEIQMTDAPINDTRKAELLSKEVEHIDIKSFDARPIVDAMKKMSFTSRDLGRATEIYNQMLADPDCTVCLVIAGSTSAGGCMDLYAQLVKSNMVDAIVATSIARNRKLEDREIPRDFRFEGVPGLSSELVQRFGQTRPATLGQALRIPGATPAAVAVIGAYLRRLTPSINAADAVQNDQP